jgi:D-alanyl-D-alanine carboxypeptidase/D-alanyl-D-alanine-endopeptidase (penicillin-binding protein 4)
VPGPPLVAHRRLVALGLVVVAALAGGAASASEREAGSDDDAGAAVRAAPVTPVLSARRVPGLLAAPVADRRLVAALDAIVARQPGVTCLLAASGGRALYSRNPDRPLTPASLEKLVTAVAAVEVLGEDFRFRTSLVATSPPEGGVVAGDAWVVGGGDALLSTAAYAARFRNQPQTVTPVEGLADAIARAGVAAIAGRLLGDESRYDADRYPDPWPARYIDQDQTGPLSALSVNDSWAAFPPHPEMRVPDEAPAADPAVHAAAVLEVVLAERGVTVTGGVGTGVAPAGAVEIAAVDSPPLRDVVAEMLRESDNQTAELLLKELAVARGQPGTTEAGAAVAAEVVADLGLAATAPVVADGSGLAAENRVTCELVQAILEGAGTESDLADGLPVAGQTGTLSRRFVDSPVEGRLRAKTGTLNQVTALAGYLLTTPGATVTFSFIANLPPELRVDEDDLALQDELALTLARYPEGPSLEELGPQPVVVEEGG